MSHHPAKVLAREDLRRLLAKVAKGRYRTRNRVIVLLSGLATEWFRILE